MTTIAFWGRSLQADDRACVVLPGNHWSRNSHPLALIRGRDLRTKSAIGFAAIISSRVIGRPFRFRSDPQAARAIVQKARTANRRWLRTAPLCGTLPVVAVFGARSLPERVSFLAARARSFSGLHLRAKELPDRVNREQPFAANLAAPSKANASNFAVGEKLIGKASLDSPTRFQARNIDKLRIDM